MQNDGYSLRYVPKVLKNVEFCLAAVENYGEALKYVPEEYMTTEVCLAAVQNTVFALEYVPEEFRTEELCLAGTKYFISRIDDSEFEEDVYFFLKHVPDDIKEKIKSVLNQIRRV